ncbi:MAG TPA: hypothetical protein VFV93_04070 [Thermomicrobiales bacterium]|nr:hypothetical protein [Thermomicrobiales bacterium]
MSIDDIPTWLLFVITTLLVAGTIELGYLAGKRAHRRSEDEKESPVSAIAGTVLALLAFILAFSFSIVTDRYDARKALVREQAASIRTAYKSSDFLPPELRDESQELYREFIALVVTAGTTGQAGDELAETVARLRDIQEQLWDLAVENVERGDTTDISSFYVQSVDEMRNVTALRVAVAVQSRMPPRLMIVLYVLVGLGMFAVGYQTAIAASRRTWMMLLLALSFSIVMTLIAVLDNPERGVIGVSQQPLIDLQKQMSQ